MITFIIITFTHFTIYKVNLLLHWMTHRSWVDSIQCHISVLPFCKHRVRNIEWCWFSSSSISLHGKSSSFNNHTITSCKRQRSYLFFQPFVLERPFLLFRAMMLMSLKMKIMLSLLSRLISIYIFPALSRFARHSMTCWGRLHMKLLL